MLLRKFFHLPIDNENYYEMIYKVCPKIFSFFDKKKRTPTLQWWEPPKDKKGNIYHNVYGVK